MNSRPLQTSKNSLRLSRWFTSIGLIYLWLASGVSHAGDFLGHSNLIEVLPESTQMVVTSQSIQSCYSVLERSEVCKQLASPVWQNVISKQQSGKVGSLLNPRPWIGLDWKDIGGIEQVGAVAAFLDGNGETTVIFLAKLGPNAENHPFVQRWIGNQGGLNRFQPATVNTTTKFLSIAGDGKAELPRCIAIGSQWICISSSTKAVQQWLGSPLMKSLQSSSPTSSAQPVFASGNWSNGETRFWLSPWALLNGYAAKNDPKLLRSAKLFGLDGLGTVSGTLLPPTASDNSWRLSYTQQLATPATKGLAILSFKTGPMVEPPKILDESMDQVGISYLDMKPWFLGVSHAVDQMIDEETPGNFADLVDSILTDPEGPKIDVRKELIYPSGPLMFSFGASGPDKKLTGQFQHNRAWACLLQDAKRASATVSKLFENDKDIKSEQIGPYQVWSTVNDESLFVAVSKGESQAVSIAAIDNTYIYLSTDTAWLKGLLSGKGSAGPVGRPALWKSHLQKMNSPAFSSQQAISLRSWFERSWARLPEPKHKEYIQTDLPSFCLTNVLVPGVATTDIPKWNQVKSAFGVLTQSTIQNAQGIEGRIWLYANPN